MADPWAQFRAPAAEQPKADDPWAEFKVIAPEKVEIVPQNSYAGLSKDEVRAKIAALPPEQRKPALKQWADATVADERRSGGAGQYVGDVVRNVVRGVPVLGAFADEAKALASAGANAVTGGKAGAPYEEAKAYQDATDRAVDKDTSKLFTANVPLIGPVDVTGATASKVAGALLSAPFTPMLRVAQGTAYLPSMANAAVTGLVYGAGHGAGEGNDLEERAKNAGYGAMIGAPLAAGVGTIGRGIGNAAGYIVNRMRPVPAPVSGYDRSAVNRVAQYAADDNLAANGPRLAAELGPEGMIADMGNNLRSATGGLARLPGEARAIVLDGLNSRKAGAPGRISSDVDAALGPPVNMPETINATAQYYKQAAAPFRQQFQNNPVPYTRELENIFSRLGDDLNPVLTAARRLANIDPASGQQQFFARQNPQGQWEMTRVPNASEWDYIKRALDGMAKGPDKNDQRIFGHWARQVRDNVDEALSPGAPANSPWAQARRLEADNFQIEEAAAAGAESFKKGFSPDQMRAEMFGVGQPPRGGLTPPALDGYRLGQRDYVRQVMGDAGTQWGPNGDSVARARLGTENAREKIAIAAGQPAADRLVRRLDAETAFERTRDLADRNSVTSTMQAVQKTLPAPVTSRDASLTQTSLSGMGMEGIRRAIGALTAGGYNDRQARIAADMARILVTQGSQRDQVIGALVQRALQNGNAQAAGLMLERYMASASIPISGRARTEDAAR